MSQKKEFETFVLKNLDKNSNEFWNNLNKEIPNFLEVLNLNNEIDKDANIEKYIKGIHKGLQYIKYDDTWLFWRF